MRAVAIISVGRVHIRNLLEQGEGVISLRGVMVSLGV